jgi:hypothetical protein
MLALVTSLGFIAILGFGVIVIIKKENSSKN